MTEAAIRPAATIVLWREGPAEPEVLMGQRGHSAAFMPSKYVFPGGGVDAVDVTTATPGLAPACIDRLQLGCLPDAPNPGTLARAALRELHEETGLYLSDPDPGALRFIFRAITPPGRSRRFDARFFLTPAALVTGDAENFQLVAPELSHLHWIGLTAARRLDLPFITEVVLAEVKSLLQGHAPAGIPFFDNSGNSPIFRRL